jgi:hypothetical protein
LQPGCDVLRDDMFVFDDEDGRLGH